jgi:Skp family chaperone for outer membrane proteins
MRARRYGKITIFFCCAVAGLAMLATGLATAEEPAGGDDAEITVGTYDMRAIFSAYDGRQAFMKRAQEIQRQAQAAQQAGDRQKLQQLQQQMQQEQQKMGAQLQQDIDDVIADVAKEQGVDIVAPEVLYSVPSVSTKNVTQAIIAELNGGTGSSGSGAAQSQPESMEQ